MKINKWIEIKNNSLLSVGENYIVITLGLNQEMLLNENNNNNNEKKINLKNFF